MSVPAAMEIGKKMMEKWGWNKGQGLGKDNSGMTSCLVLKKQDGSSTQGRIEMSTPQVYTGLSTVATAPAAAGAEVAGTPGAAGQATATAAAPGEALEAPMDEEALRAAAAEFGVELDAPANADTDAKRRRLGSSPMAATAMTGPAGITGLLTAAGAAAAGLYDIDPREALAGGLQGGGAHSAMAAAAAAAASELQKQLAAMQAQGGVAASVAATIAQDTTANIQLMTGMAMPGGQLQLALPAPPAQEAPKPMISAKDILKGDGPMPADYQPPPKRVRVRQYVRDDWRWSKGTEALWCFEEVQLAPSLLSLARKVLGEGSRYPARIADDTDCATEVTAWGTLL